MPWDSCLAQWCLSPIWTRVVHPWQQVLLMLCPHQQHDGGVKGTPAAARVSRLDGRCLLGYLRSVVNNRRVLDGSEDSSEFLREALRLTEFRREKVRDKRDSEGSRSGHASFAYTSDGMSCQYLQLQQMTNNLAMSCFSCGVFAFCLGPFRNMEREPFRASGGALF